MSYLLTEIALEMLGYTFFDVNGDYKHTNFQPGRRVVHHIPQFETNHPSLRKLLEEAPQDAKYASPQESPAQSSDKQILTGRAKDSDNESAPVNENTRGIETMTPQQINEIKSTLLALLKLERGKIAKQISSNKSFFFKKCQKQAKLRRKPAPSDTDLAKFFCRQEQEHLRKEATDMRNMRQMVEGRVRNLKPEEYEKYVETFQLCGDV